MIHTADEMKLTFTENTYKIYRILQFNRCVGFFKTVWTLFLIKHQIKSLRFVFIQLLPFIHAYTSPSYCK